jgi:hypothetical protein
MGCAPSKPNARDVAYTMTRPVAPKARAPTFPAAHTEMANGVASSGAAGGDSNLIGRFGVGF